MALAGALGISRTSKSLLIVQTLNLAVAAFNADTDVTIVRILTSASTFSNDRKAEDFQNDRFYNAYTRNRTRDIMNWLVPYSVIRRSVHR